MSWMKIKGFSRYSINKLGEVRNDKSMRILKQGTSNHGYITVALTDDSDKRKTAKIHRLIGKAFIANSGNKPCINHIDADKANNSIDNLEWCTHKENTQHAMKNNLQPFYYAETNANSKFTNDDVSKIEKMRFYGLTLKEIADVMGSNKSTISSMFTGRTSYLRPTQRQYRQAVRR